MKELFTSILTVVLAFLLIILLVGESKSTSDIQKLNAKMEVQTSEYRLQKRELQKQIEELRNEEIKNELTTDSLMFVFSEVDDTFFDEIVPLLNDNNLCATLCITKDNMPVENSVLSLYEINYLLNLGWQTAMYWNGEEEIDDWYLDTTRLMSEVGVEIPRAVLIDSSNYDASLNKEFLSLGLNDLIVRCTTEDDIILTETQGLNIVTAYGWYTTDSVNALDAENKDTNSIAFVVGTGEESVAYEKTQFEVMIQNILSRIANKELVVTTPIGAVRYAAENERAYQELLNARNSAIDDLKEKIEQLDEKINNIYEDYKSAT